MAELIIEAGRVEKQYWRDLWSYRELLYFLAWRDILARYKQTVMGVAWSVLRPFATMVVFTLVFNKLAKLESGQVPYPVMVFAAMLPWQLFANALAECGNSLVGNANLISKIYFPRLLVPAGAIVTSLVDFAISLVMLAVLMGWYGFWPDWRILTLPLFLLIALVAAMGGGLWLAALNVKYRDFRIVVPFIVQFGLYVSPVGFSSAIVPEQWRLAYSLNPLAGVIEGFRWALLRGQAAIDWTGFALSGALAALILAGGLWFFRKTERTFADII